MCQMIPVLTKFDREMSNLASVRRCVASVRHCVCARFKDHGSFAIIIASMSLRAKLSASELYLWDKIPMWRQCVFALRWCVVGLVSGAEHVKVPYLSSTNLYESNYTGFDQI